MNNKAFDRGKKKIGWVCSLCKRSYSPVVTSCPHCNKEPTPIWMEHG